MARIFNGQGGKEYSSRTQHPGRTEDFFRAEYVTDYKCVVEKSQDGGFFCWMLHPGVTCDQAICTTRGSPPGTFCIQRREVTSFFI